MLRGKVFLSIFSLVLVSSLAWADGTIPGSRYTSGRAAGMADAFLPLADDAGTQIQMNNDYASGADQNFYKIPSLSSYAPVAAKSPGTFPGASYALFPNFESRGFALGVLYSSAFSTQSDGTTVHYRSLRQFIPTAGMGVKLFSGRLRLGYSIQWVNQATGDLFVPATSSLSYSQFLRQGSAISHNFGATVTVPMEYLPTFSAVARNILTARYGTYVITPLASSPDPSPPPDEKMSIDGSFSVTPKIGHGASFTFVFEERDLTNTSGLTLLTRSTAGVEFTVKNILFLRGGYGSLYPAAGVGMRSSKAEFAFSWYSEELGTPTLRVRDARYILQYQVRAF